MYRNLSMLKRSSSLHVIDVGWSLLRSRYECKHVVVVVSALMLGEFDITLCMNLIDVHKDSCLVRTPVLGHLLLDCHMNL